MRIDSIDIAKGFAIVLVVMGHVLYMNLYGSDNAGQSSLFQIIYTFHMPLFIFLSGLVFNTDIKLNELPSKLYSKFRLILVPFLIIGSIKNVLLNLGPKTLYIYVFHYFITYTLDMTYLSDDLIQINSFWVDFVLSLSISCLIIGFILFFTKILLADKKLANMLFYIGDKL